MSLGWGTFAFGAVYPWAYWPLVLIAATAGILSRAGAVTPSSVPPGLATGLVVFLLLIPVQLIPLPLRVMQRVAPGTVVALTQLYPAVAGGIVHLHPLSLGPSATVAGLAVFSALSAVVLWFPRVLTLNGPRHIAGWIAFLGSVLAIVGIVQAPLYRGKIYGFWRPISDVTPFGPFVNRNHFAGWMLMALPLTFGLIAALVSRSRLGSRSRRDRLLWFTSENFAQVLLLLASAGLMSLGLLMTDARSADAALVVALLGGAAVAGRRASHPFQRLLAPAVIIVVVGAAASWYGFGTIHERFAASDWRTLNGRRGAWSDAVAIFGRFPLFGTGIGAYGLATLLYQTYDLSQHYAQAHNDYLQLLAEGGILLVMPATTAIALFVNAVRTRFRDEASNSTYWVRLGAVMGLVAIAIQETVEFSLQMPGNALLFSVLCAIALHRSRPPVPTMSAPAA